MNFVCRVTGNARPQRPVIAMLVDIVRNLLLSIPVRGNGTIDEGERKVLADLAGWMAENGEAIFETRTLVGTMVE